LDLLNPNFLDTLSLPAVQSSRLQGKGQGIKKIALDCILHLWHDAYMKVLTIRNVPNSIYDALTALAKENQRSLQQQTLLILEQTAKFLKNSQGNLNKALIIRKSLEGRELGNTLKELREDRDR